MISSLKRSKTLDMLSVVIRALKSPRTAVYISYDSDSIVFRSWSQNGFRF